MLIAKVGLKGSHHITFLSQDYPTWVRQLNYIKCNILAYVKKIVNAYYSHSFKKIFSKLKFLSYLICTVRAEIHKALFLYINILLSLSERRRVKIISLFLYNIQPSSTPVMRQHYNFRVMMNIPCLLTLPIPIYQKEHIIITILASSLRRTLLLRFFASLCRVCCNTSFYTCTARNTTS